MYKRASNHNIITTAAKCEQLYAVEKACRYVVSSVEKNCCEELDETPRYCRLGCAKVTSRWRIAELSKITRGEVPLFRMPDCRAEVNFPASHGPNFLHCYCNNLIRGWGNSEGLNPPILSSTSRTGDNVEWSKTSSWAYRNQVLNRANSRFYSSSFSHCVNRGTGWK